MKVFAGTFKTVALMLAILLYALAGLALPGKAAEVSFTQEELDYINQAAVLKAVSIDGIAPLSYKDAQGDIKGIGVSLLGKISAITGLVFEYELYGSVAESLDSNFDLYFNAASSYAPDNLFLSRPYLESETILYMNSSADPQQLNNKMHAAIRGGTLPEGIKAENVIYYDTRENALNAVEKGEADYGYGNAYSVAFYTLQNAYKNIITIPSGKEIREYCLGVPAGNDILLSILNKSIGALDEAQMQTLILDVASQVDRKITFPMITNAYGKEIYGVVFLVMTILLFSVFSNVRANNKLKIKNKRYRLLAHISNEFLFECNVKSGEVELSEKFYQINNAKGRVNEITGLIKEALIRPGYNNSPDNAPIVKLPLANGNTGVFRIVYSNLYDDKKNLYSIIGKLIDISEEVKEKEALVLKSQLDGLTGLYNATTAKELIFSSIKKKADGKTDAFIIIDCDNFKDINDTFGHLTGDRVLKNISASLESVFRRSDIIGRIGGDEFCVYIHDISSKEAVCQKCQHLKS